ncbi:MAG: reverse transcriptase family protein, partial [Gloeomargaritales cyanobacterium]
IRECAGPWASRIVLAAKPHQEHVSDIDQFVWRMCVSYRGLNSVTCPFEYPITRCAHAIEDFGDAVGPLFFISLDARQGFHQIRVRFCDQEKLAFFAPDGKKYTYKVVPFGPRNAPAVYTAMMRQFRHEWDGMFQAAEDPTDGVYGSRVIIDDILLWSNGVAKLLRYFECVCKIFRRYRCSFRLDKCDFFKGRFEYVGHDITSEGNCPARSKFDLINDWPMPETTRSLHSFVGLVGFYSKFCPWFEVDLYEFRCLIQKHKHAPGGAIPVADWTAEHRALFAQLKHAVTSSPCLARYDSRLPCFLKTDWSADGMGFVMMQPEDSEAANAAIAKLRSGGDCDFDITMKGARLQPLVFGSRRCDKRERHFHSFVGEAACGRWAIGQCRRYLWGCHFYWICDCQAMKQIFDYDGNIHMVSRWAQELFGYSFTVVH